MCCLPLCHFEFKFCTKANGYCIYVCGVARPSNRSERKQMTDIPYRKKLSCLIYLSQRTRPDTSLSAAALCLYAQAYALHHLLTMKLLMRYFLCTDRSVIKIGSVNDKQEIDLKMYSDAVWAVYLSDYRYTISIVIMLIHDSISWSENKISRFFSHHLSQSMQKFITN